MDLVNVLNPQWAKIMQNVPPEFRDQVLDSKLVSEVPKYRDGKPVTNKDIEWSDTHVRQMAREAGNIIHLHPFAFDQASAYLHASGMYVIRMLTWDGQSKSFGIRERHLYEEQLALRLTHDLALNSIDLRLQCAPNKDHQARFDQCVIDFSLIWGYPAHI